MKISTSFLVTRRKGHSQDCQVMVICMTTKTGKRWSSLFFAVEVHGGREYEKEGMFPQIFHEFGVIACKPGNWYNAFELSVEGNYYLLPCKYYNRFGVIEKVPVAKSKLVDPETKNIVTIEEKSVPIPRRITLCALTRNPLPYGWNY